MAQGYVDPIGGELTIPGAYPSITVAPANSGLATTGVLVIMGEADAGPAFDEETELEDNSFGPDDVQAIISKYKTGPLVDAARAAAGAAVDIDITSTFSRIIPVKTNLGAKATSGPWSTYDEGNDFPGLDAKSSGLLGNLIYYTISNEVNTVYPQTGLVTYIPQPAEIIFQKRQNGGNPGANITVAEELNPAAAAALLGANGGTARAGCVPNSGVDTLDIAVVSGPLVTLTLSNPWVGVAVGDTLEIVEGGAFVGTDNHNIGWYVVTAVNSTVVTAMKLADKTQATAVYANPVHSAGAVVAPVAVGSAAVTYPTDLVFYEPINLIWGVSALDGVAPTMEIAATSALNGDTDGRNAFRQLGSNSNAPVISSASSSVILSGTERKMKLTLERKYDNVSEEYIVGGEIGLKFGYQGWSAYIQLNEFTIDWGYQLTNISTPVSGSINYTEYPTIGDVAAFLASLPGWVASAGTAVLANLPSTALDRIGAGGIGVYGATTYGGYAGKVKTDGYRYNQALAASYLAAPSSTPTFGLPDNVATATFFAGGTRGATTAARITSAISAMEQLRANFIVPCFSRDATDDITDGLTDVSSDYTIAAINSAIKTHVHRMSGMKTKRNRQAFLSFRGAYTDAETASGDLASHRCSMYFQDVKNSSSGAIVQYQPYIAAVLAAASQAGAFYKSLVRKQVNVTAAIQAAGDWTYNRDSHLENALKAGLNPIRKAEEGGFIWVSDQTTYGKDTKNFYNSIQMVYAGDIVALTTAQRMDAAFVGQSVADTSASVALSYLDSIMADMLRLKLIAPSSDAPLGYRNAQVRLDGSALRVSVEVKIAGSIYFIPISFYVTEITQTA